MFEEVAIAGKNFAAVQLGQYDMWMLSVYRPPSFGAEENRSVIVNILGLLCSSQSHYCWRFKFAKFVLDKWWCHSFCEQGY